MIKEGSFVLSLDYELLWGIIEKKNVMNYAKTNVVYVQDVIDRLLHTFEKYNVKSTFAIVGLLMCKNKQEALNFSPKIKPTYNKTYLSPYGNYIDQILDEEFGLYFSNISIDKLKSSKYVEIATHTFSHYYCWEDGQTLEQFEADIIAAINIANKYDINIKSIIFPRNQVSTEYLKMCSKNGIDSYRGNASRFFNKTENRFLNYKYRIARMLDSYIPIGGDNTYKYSDLYMSSDLPINIPASRFFRPFNKKLALFESIRISRIKKEMTKAAIKGEMYHLWWHPHNFGANIDENFYNLEQILKHFNYCRNKYKMQSFTMSELSTLVKENYKN